MTIKRIPTTFLTVMALLTIGGCSSTGIKQENTELKQQVEHETQLRQDYADKLSAAQTASVQEKEKVRAEAAALRRDLNRALQENQANVQKLENLTVIDIQQNVLFKSGQAELSAEGKTVVREIAEVLKKHPGFHIRIEGHTDNQPIHATLKNRYPSNWELSGARASTVVKYMIHALNMPAENLSIAGYASYRPAASNDTEEGRAQNRRIRAVLFKG